jgi:hypothetical protein
MGEAINELKTVIKAVVSLSLWREFGNISFEAGLFVEGDVGFFGERRMGLGLLYWDIDE